MGAGGPGGVGHGHPDHDPAREHFWCSAVPESAVIKSQAIGATNAPDAGAVENGSIQRHTRIQATPEATVFRGRSDCTLEARMGSFEVIRRMRVVPFGLGLVLILVAATLTPMAPLVFLAFPMDTLLELTAKLIFGL